MTRSRETGDVGYRAYKKNFLINGDFSVNQRVGPFTNVSKGTYTLDRWAAKTNTTTITQSDAYLEDGRKVVTLRMDRTASATQRRIRQLIELNSDVPESTFHTGETYKLSFYMWTDIGDGATPSPFLEAAFVTDIDDVAPSACTISNITSEPFVGQFGLITADITIDGDTTGKLALEVALGVTYSSSQAVGTITRFALAQLEEGTTATPFEYVLPQEQLSACQRYYWRGLPLGSYTFSAYAANARFSLGFQFPLPMRRVPDITSDFSTANTSNVDTAFGDNGVSIVSSSVTSMGANFQSRASITSTNCSVTFNNSFVAADAEL